MPKQDIFIHSFNAGVTDKKHLARVDLERMRLAAEDQTNLMATTTGNMFLRPALGFMDNTIGDDPAWLKEFIFSSVDAALLEFSDEALRVVVDDAVISRPAVSTTISQGDFGGTGAWVLGWQDGAGSGSHDGAEIASDRLRLEADALGSRATARQEVSVLLADRGVEHALRIWVTRGPVTFRVGSAFALDDLVTETTLKTGYHSLAFTPTTASFFILLKTESELNKFVKSIEIEGSGDMVLPAPWGASRLSFIRGAQSADVLFVACDGVPQYRIERRSRRSWSVVRYNADDGPFMLARSAPVRLRAEGLRGNTTLTASDDFFTPDHVGAIFRIFNNQQHIDQTIADDHTFTDAIRVTGLSGGNLLNNDRDWTYTVSGTWSSTLICQRSYDNKDYGFKKYRKDDADTGGNITANVTGAVQKETDDNAIIYYRIGFAGSYTDGVARVQIDYDGGGGYGVGRVTAYNSQTSVDIEVLKHFTNVNYSSDWLEGMWSAEQGYPTAVALSEGRLFWAGFDKFWGSVSDAYESFDEETKGDSGPLNRSIAIGGVNEVQWMLPLQKLVLGTNGLEASVKSSSFDEPLSPTNNTIKSASSVGSGPVDAVKIDGKGIFVDRTLKALFELLFSSEANDYVASELTRLCASWYSSGVVQLAVSRRPDTRVWAVLANGTCMCMVYEPKQQVLAFIPVITDGEFESVAVLPSAEQDNVYFVVKRTIESETRRHLEKMASDADAAPITVAKSGMDCFITGVNSPASATLSGFDHLIGEQVKVWADGAPLTEVSSTSQGDMIVPRLFTVSASGTVTLPSAVGSYIGGLPYSGSYKSSRLAYASAGGTAMLQNKKIAELGLVLTDYVRSGIRYGRDMDHLMPLPELLDYSAPDEVSSDVVVEESSIMFDGDWNKDARIHMTAEWPVNFNGLVFNIETQG